MKMFIKIHLIFRQIPLYGWTTFPLQPKTCLPPGRRHSRITLIQAQGNPIFLD